MSSLWKSPVHSPGAGARQSPGIISFQTHDLFVNVGQSRQVFSSSEPQCSLNELIIPMRRRPPSLLSSLLSKMFKYPLLWNLLGYRSQNSHRASLGRGNESLYKWSRLHDGRHYHIWYKPLQVFFSRASISIIFKLGTWHRGLKFYSLF